MMRHGSLFSGIGGFDLPAEWMGWENVFHCEWNPFGQKVLKYYWPKAISYADITKTDFSIHRGRIDILTGGFPCQPFSTAGKRKGKEDDRYLWPEMLRAVNEIRPTWICGENVAGLASMVQPESIESYLETQASILSEDDQEVITEVREYVIETICNDLERIGYSVQPIIIPACATGAPHRRDRIWFVAYAASDRQQWEWSGIETENGEEKSGITGIMEGRLEGLCQFGTPTNSCSEGRKEWEQNRGWENSEEDSPGLELWDKRLSGNGDAPNSNNKRLEGRPQTGNFGSGRTESHKQPERLFDMPDWEYFPTQSPIRLRNDGISSSMARYISSELLYEISKTSKENRIENLPEVWGRVSSPEIWQEVRRLYSLESKEILQQTMQLYSTDRCEPGEFSPFSEEFSKGMLLHLRKYKEFGSSPHGQKLEKQRSKEFSNTLSFLPHEVALAAGRFEASVSKFETWHRNESIKAGGNAIVPQVAFEIFKAIESYNSLHQAS